ncbi:MAG: RidA family protein [Acidobacteriales bacterium]|nr:RidA family protein [Terriglobales bacterium]
MHRHINLPRATELARKAPFSDAVLAGNTLYLSGRIGLDPKTNQVPATPEEEARNVMEQFRGVLKEAGMDFEDVVSVQVFCSDVAHFDKFNSVYRTYFKEDEYPARAFLGSGKLLFNARFEVQMIAVKR